MERKTFIGFFLTLLGAICFGTISVLFKSTLDNVKLSVYGLNSLKAFFSMLSIFSAQSLLRNILSINEPLIGRHNSFHSPHSHSSNNNLLHLYNLTLNLFKSKYFWPICGGIGAYLCTTFYAICLQTENATKASFLLNLYVITTPLLTGFFSISPHAKHGLTLFAWFGVFLALIGGYFLVGCADSPEKCGSELSFGVLFGVLAAACDSMDYIFEENANILQQDMINFTIIMLTSSFLLTVITTCIFESYFWTTVLPSLTWIQWIQLICAGGCDGVGSLMIAAGMKHINSTTSSIIMGFSCITSLFEAHFFLGETLSFKQYVGCGLVWIACCLVVIETGRMIEKYENENENDSSSIEIESNSLLSSGNKQSQHQQQNRGYGSLENRNC